MKRLIRKIKKDTQEGKLFIPEIELLARSAKQR